MGRRKKTVRRHLVGVDIKACVSFIDTVVLILPRMMPKEMFREFRLALLRNRRKKQGSYIVRKVMRPNDTFFFKITVHQPTRGTMEVLAQATSYDSTVLARVLEVHVALDLVTKTRADAEDLHLQIVGQLLTSARIHKPVLHVGKTTYFNRKTRKGVEVACYSDRNSKVAGFPCCHLEWRTIGSQPLKLASLSTIEDLVSLQHDKFWTSRISLWTPPSVDALVRARKKILKKEGGAPTCSDERLRSDALLTLRRASGVHGNVVANDLLVDLYKRPLYHPRPKRLFSRQPNTWMLPHSENALWTP